MEDHTAVSFQDGILDNGDHLVHIHRLFPLPFPLNLLGCELHRSIPPPLPYTKRRPAQEQHEEHEPDSDRRHMMKCFRSIVNHARIKV
jgi:hypothetical protein